MRTLALALNEEDRLNYIKILTNIFRENGICSVYSFPPAIIIGEGDFYKNINIDDGIFSFGPKINKLDDFYLLASNNDKLKNISSIPTPGLFLSKEYIDYPITIKVKVKKLILVEYSLNYFSIISERPLRRDIDF